MKQHNLMSALITVVIDAKASTNLPHPSSREGQLSTGRRNFGVFSLMGDQRDGCTRGSFVQRNSVPSLQIRCMRTAKRRASATMAFRTPRRLATFIAQAFNQDHFFTRVSRTWAAS